MSKTSRIVLGFLAAAAIGGGGGYALGPVSESIAAHRMAPPSGPLVREPMIAEVQGDVRMLRSDGGWIPLAAKDPLPLPAAIEAKGVLSTLAVTLGRIQVSAGHDARLVISEKSSAIQLDEGHAKISGGNLTTYVPRHRMKISGTNYGAWVEDELVVVAVVEGEVEIDFAGDVAKYGPGRALVYRGKKSTTYGLEPELSIKIEHEQKRQNERRITATVPPATFVFQKTNDGYERVTLTSNTGKVTVTLPGAQPSAGELVALDAAGRIAHLGGAADAVKAALEGTPKSTETKKVEADPPPPTRPPKEKKSTKRKRTGPKPLVKPEAKPPPLDDEDLPPVDDTLDPDEPEPAEESSDEPPTLRPIDDDDEKVD